MKSGPQNNRKKNTKLKSSKPIGLNISYEYNGAIVTSLIKQYNSAE